MIQHYPKHWGKRHERKTLSSKDRRADEQNIGLPERTNGKSKKKNTKQWCKGKVGVEHQLILRPYSPYLKTVYKEVCKVCGKVIRLEFVDKD